MKICILGVARSGTTALYSLLQEMLALSGGEPYDYVYEPFLWHPDVFNGRYNEVKGNFQYIRSLSHLGIHHHLTLPMLVCRPHEHAGNPYIRQFMRADRPQRNVLAKLIRANGRARLLGEISPECRFIFIIRNPLDTVHSVLNQFSFFGYEFHRDDYPRFRAEVESVFATRLPDAAQASPCEREADYWLYMNRFFLEQAATWPGRLHLLSHEAFSRDRNAVVKKLCEFLEIPFQKAFLEAARRKTGALTGAHELTAAEMECLLPRLESYPALLAGQRIGGDVDAAAIQAKYRRLKGERNLFADLYGLNPVHFKRRIEAEMRKNADLEKEIAQRAMPEVT